MSHLLDTIDTRDLVEELNNIGEENLNEEEAERRAAIHALFEEIESYAGDRPEDGIFLIRDDYFEKYAQELADDIGAIDRNASWPLNCIDWKEAARQLQMDYTSVEFDGSTYWYR